MKKTTARIRKVTTEPMETTKKSRK